MISVIVPVYNAEKYLERCLDSLLNQTYKNIEIILVNDSSTDNSFEKCTHYAKTYSNVYAFDKKNEGAGIARNFGIQHANGELIGFCDADDFVDYEMFEKMACIMSECNSDLVYCLNTDENKVPRKSGKIEEFTDNRIKKLMVGEVGTRPEVKREVLYGSSVWRGLYKKRIIDDNNLVFLSEREVGSEDLVFNLEYLSKINKAVYFYDELYYHCLNDESMTHGKNHFNIENELNLYRIVGNLLKKKAITDYNYFAQRLLIKRIRLAVIMLCRDLNALNFMENISEIREIYRNKALKDCLDGYPGYRLPIKQSLLFFCMKYRCALLTVLFCKLSEIKKNKPDNIQLY